MAISAGDTLEQMGQALDVACHVFPDDQAFLFNGDFLAGSFDPAELSVDLCELFLISLITEDAVGVVQKLIAGGALHRPRRRQFLRQIENLFDNEISIAEFLSKALQIGERIVESVDMIDSYAGDFLLAREP